MEAELITGGVKLKPYYTLVPSSFGTLSIIWWEIDERPKVIRLLLPNEQGHVEDIIQRTFIGASLLSCPTIRQLSEQIKGFIKGEAVNFELNIIALEECSEFQRSVLLVEHKIPRGWVSTYGRIAQRLGIPKGARAVGRALSLNPFPIIIPCHRAIRSNGELGGFQGGLRMKRALLELEEVEFSQQGRVLTQQIYY